MKKVKLKIYNSIEEKQRLRWSRGKRAKFGTQVCGFKPGRSGRKNPQHAFLRRGSKAVGPMSGPAGDTLCGVSCAEFSEYIS